MKNRVSTKVYENEYARYFEHIANEQIFRDLARELIRKMPLGELHKLMKLTKVDPNSEESQELLSGTDCPEWKKCQIDTLRIERAIFFTVECVLPD